MTVVAIPILHLPAPSPDGFGSKARPLTVGIVQNVFIFHHLKKVGLKHAYKTRNVRLFTKILRQ